MILSFICRYHVVSNVIIKRYRAARKLSVLRRFPADVADGELRIFVF